ncbi:MAG TPA: adenine deaminase [Bacteroidales bacterium]|nr:adenine deaminase [Bacteroidales bacterium]
MKNNNYFRISGNIIDIHERKIFKGSLLVKDGGIVGIESSDDVPEVFILPGLIDSHIHIESSMITPGAFATAAVRHGTVGVVTDPHEIANVMGIEGVMFMIEDSGKVPMKFWFGAPSCVPATGFETAGATISVDEIRKLLSLDKVKFLSEMMNYPGVIYDDAVVGEKLGAARAAGKPIDGHAPGLRGEMLAKYVSAGISTDHECSSIDEALEKISLGMKIIIREGSAARNLDSLKELYRTNPGMIMLCSDDLHPEMLKVRHINKLVAKLISEGYDVFDVIRSATLNPHEHYSIDNGLMREGDPADLVIVDDLRTMNVLETWIDGSLVYKNGETKFAYIPGKPVNNFHASETKEQDLSVPAYQSGVKVIRAFEGELLTGEMIWKPLPGAEIEPDLQKDILKIVVKDRYHDSPPAAAFISGFGLKSGAFASSIAHDSHNIICVGTNDEDMVRAINEIASMKGGLAVVSGDNVSALQLDIAGIMSTRSCEDIATEYQHLNDLVKSMGCPMNAPFMTLSFMALLVIPDLKISDKGLFDVREFRLVSNFVEE